MWHLGDSVISFNEAAIDVTRPETNSDFFALESHIFKPMFWYGSNSKVTNTRVSGEF